MLRNATGFAWADRPIRLIESPIAAGQNVTELTGNLGAPGTGRSMGR
jgi:hypothetical protein